MTVAVLSHLTVIGIESFGDGGLLFTLAIIVFSCSAALLVLHKEQGSKLWNKLTSR
jgi:hypothetical protein